MGVDETTVLAPITGEESEEHVPSRRELRRNRTKVRQRRRTVGVDGIIQVSPRILLRRRREMLQHCFTVMTIIAVLYVVGAVILSFFAVGAVAKTLVILTMTMAAVGSVIPSFLYWRHAC